METGDSHLTSLDRADLVPEAARMLREQGQPDMASVLENTTDGARKVRGAIAVQYGTVQHRHFD